MNLAYAILAARAAHAGGRVVAAGDEWLAFRAELGARRAAREAPGPMPTGTSSGPLTGAAACAAAD